VTDRAIGAARSTWTASAVLVALVSWIVVASEGPARAAGSSPEPTIQTNGRVWTILYKRGVVYIGGDFTAVRPPGASAGTGEIARHHAAAIDASTGKLLRWDPNVDGRVYTIRKVRDRVYVGGSFSSVGGARRSNLAAVDARDGHVLRWRPSTDGYVRVLRRGPNGNLFIGGRFNHVNGVSRSKIAELRPSGRLVRWAPKIAQVKGFACPPRCGAKVWTIAFANGAVYFGGHFGLVNGVSRNSVAAVAIDDDSNLWPWNPDVYASANCPTCKTVETERVFNMIVYDSKMYMCGGFWKAEGGSVLAYNLLVTNLTDGAKDPTFAAGNDGDTPNCAIRKGVFYFGGHFDWVGPVCSQNPPGTSHKCTSGNSTHRQHIAAVDARTGALLPWNPGANSRTGVWSFGSSRRYLGVGGDFTKIGGRSQQGFAEFSNANLP
jgi:hypothetical protein